jgi:hypothetical protein
LYRIGRVLRHVAVDGRVSIEAEVPRRILDHFPGPRKNTSHGKTRTTEKHRRTQATEKHRSTQNDKSDGIPRP